MSGGEIVSDRLGLDVNLLYSSFMTYAFNFLGSVFSAFFFAILTRALTIEEYGVFVMILRYVGYFSIPSVIFTYWLPRDISRGRNTSKTGLLYSMGVGLLVTPLYLVFALGISGELGQPLFPILLSSAIIVLEYVYAALSYASQGHKPQFVGFGQFAFKAGQAITGIAMVSGLSLGLTGAVLSFLFGRLIMDLVLLRLNLPLLRKSKLSAGTAILWAKSSWRSLLGSLTCLIFWLDVLVVSLVFGSEIPVAFYGVSMMILMAVTYASSIPSSLYPKVLAKKNLEDLGEAIWLTLLITVPIASFIVLYAEPICAILGTKYLPAAWPLRAFLAASVMQTVSGIAVISYLGLEGKDSPSISQKELIKSAVFKNDLVNLSVNAAYILMVFLASYLLDDPVAVSVAWGASMLASFTISLFLSAKLLKRDFGQLFPFRTLADQASRIILPAFPLALLPFAFPISRLDTLWVLVPLLAVHIVLYFSGYIALLYLISPKFRSTLEEVRRGIGSAVGGLFGQRGSWAPDSGKAGGNPVPPPPQ
ncbi:MAG: hypothetical protein ACO0C9_03825 [Candidatus Methanosuratincola verstraetei]|uniref:Polysaccharide biosynthesis protein C-terminal domain-containing protein n=1 Tax=Methanosuratincola subterraneus TaxID=2593994 RepID=A0A3S3TS00_METS7|nr:MAG: hypothetical protein Metus_1400 [Candidatus Methanosuratincola subterraneus]